MVGGGRSVVIRLNALRVSAISAIVTGFAGPWSRTAN